MLSSKGERPKAIFAIKKGGNSDVGYSYFI